MPNTVQVSNTGFQLLTSLSPLSLTFFSYSFIILHCSSLHPHCRGLISTEYPPVPLHTILLGNLGVNFLQLVLQRSFQRTFEICSGHVCFCKNKAKVLFVWLSLLFEVLLSPSGASYYLLTPQQQRFLLIC